MTQTASSLFSLLEPSWEKALSMELTQPYIQNLTTFIETERSSKKEVYPPEELVFNAFKMTPFYSARVVIIGQDPYHGPNQAHGLCFSVPRGIKAPRSLCNIYKELQDDLGITPPAHGSLSGWAKQGVLLLNTTLTVRRGEPLSHHGHGWERFTDAVVRVLYQRKDPLIFVLWGRFAQEKLEHLPLDVNSNHLILKAAHPSPFSASRGFFGCRHFSKINNQLELWGQPTINWEL